MTEPWKEEKKNPISTAVSALDMRLSVLGWVSRELADISSHSVACVSLLLSWIACHMEKEFLIRRQRLIPTTAATTAAAAQELMRRRSAYLHLSNLPQKKRHKYLVEAKFAAIG